ncbi:hypothetical protein [Hymenobacter jeollabukensis]|uniref:Uncharacterized protein n=1 Tax=Hymenobacter jeollabukensis TaxID=2025313 RepID=A0A5R8WK09_9BACT|nr:hypothetical protein [Hymenobacter jeollabukensis]TLM89362.1 hypothetical protein FDY95_20020 [Hymenobacter jeollabukensis]
MEITNPQLYEELQHDFFHQLRECVALRLVSDADGRSTHDVANQCVTDIMALGFNETREAAAADLLEELANNPFVEEVYEEDVLQRIEFSAANFSDEIQLFRQFIQAVNHGRKDAALQPVQARLMTLRLRKGR